MEVVLEGSVQDLVVRIQPFKLIAPVDVCAIGIEKDSEFDKEHVHVNRCNHGEEEHWGGPHKLIDVLIRDHRKRSGIMKDVMMFVVGPKEIIFVTKIMVIKLKEVGEEPDCEETRDEISPSVFSHSTVRLR